MVRALLRLLRFPMSIAYYLLLAAFFYVAHFAELPTVRFAVESSRYILPGLIMAWHPLFRFKRLIKRTLRWKL